MNVRQALAGFIGLLLILLPPASSRAGEFSLDAKGNRVDVKAPDNPYTRFKKSLTFEDFQHLDSVDREYAIPEIIIESLNPNSKLRADQKIGIKHVLSQYFDTMPLNAREAIERKVLWISFLTGMPGLGQNVADKFLSRYPDQRGQQLCTMVRDATEMIRYKGEKPTIHYLMNLGREQMGLLAKLIDANKASIDEKCQLGDEDTKPLSLKEMRAEIVKAGLAPAFKDSPGDQAASARLRTPCKLSTIKSTFDDAISAIEKGGRKTKVYLGLHSMTCPIYGLVLKDPKEVYRYYPDSFREDFVPAVRFKSADDILAMFQIVPTSPAAGPAQNTNSGSTKK